METDYFLPGAGFILFAFFLLITTATSVGVGGLFYMMGHFLKQWLFKVTPAGRKLRVGMGSEQRGFGEWPWYLTDKLPLLFGIIGSMAFFYAIIGPVMHICGLGGK